MEQDNQINYLKELNKELVRELSRYDYLVTQSKNKIDKQQKAFSMLVEIQRVIAVARSNKEFYKAIPKLIDASLKASATYIYSAIDDSRENFQLLGYHHSNKREEQAVTDIETFSVSDIPEHGTCLLINNNTDDDPLKSRLKRKFNFASMIVCPVYYNENTNLVLVTGLKMVDGLSILDFDQEDARAIEAVGILISSYLRKIELIKLYETDKIKTEFVSNLSHEFRTPLTLVMGLLEGLKKKYIPGMSGEDLDAFEVVMKNAQRIQQLIDQLLDISKLETNTEFLSVKRTDLNETISRISKSFSALAQKKNILFHYSYSYTSEETWFDGDKLEKIVTNLLSNAFKFTPKDGNVEFNVKARSDSSKLSAVISVKDNGPGIPSDEQVKIFERFYQVKSTKKGKSEGTGVGLYLVKKLTELHHGTIQLKSTFKEGSEFILTLPVGKAAFTGEEFFVHNEVLNGDDRIGETIDEIYIDEESLPGGDNTRPLVLIVEDNEDLNSFIAANLSERFQIIKAYEGKQGFEMALTHIPDLIVTDVMMPEMDGVEMCGRLKNNDKTNHIPIIILTAKADKLSKFKGLDAGTCDYIVKPFDMKELSIKIKNHIETAIQLRNKCRKELLTAPVESESVSSDDNMVRSVINLMKDNVDNTEFHVENICEQMLISKAQLYRKIDALTGFKPIELLRIIRIRTAAALFQKGHNNVAQVMYQVGFSNQSNFARNFKKQFKINPSEYIRQYTNYHSSY